MAERSGAAADARPVRLGVVGLGYWGPNLVRNMAEVEGAEVAWICDLRPDVLAATGRRYPAVRQTTDYGEVLADESVTGVVISTPVATHAPLARQALEAGKHVFVEKPMAGSSEEARQLMEFAAQNELVLMPGHTFLYSPPVNKIRDLIASGELGEIYFISTSRVNLGLHQSDVSVVWDLGAHDFSILRYWLGQNPSTVLATSRGCIIEDVPDVAFISLTFPSGTIAHVELSWLAPSKLRRAAIVGSERMVVYDDTSNEPVRIYDSGVVLPTPLTFGEFRLTYRTGDIVSPPIEATEPLGRELRDFCDAIRYGGEPTSSAQVGLDVILVIEAVERSLAQNVAVAVDESNTVVG